MYQISIQPGWGSKFIQGSFGMYQGFLSVQGNGSNEPDVWPMNGYKDTVCYSNEYEHFTGQLCHQGRQCCHAPPDTRIRNKCFADSVDLTMESLSGVSMSSIMCTSGSRFDMGGSSIKCMGGPVYVPSDGPPVGAIYNQNGAHALNGDGYYVSTGNAIEHESICSSVYGRGGPFSNEKVEVVKMNTSDKNVALV